ncbi:MAG TPA: hypothetical protein DCQ31_16155 [Bacteroidales bacterium]|nr:hypothetical protein [Bacteroidales bacterium]
MEKNSAAKVLRIYISNTDKFKHEPLYETLVFAAKRYKMAGATVLRGTMGYGKSTGISNLRFWELTDKIPVVVEIIDTEEKIALFVEAITPYFEKVTSGCLITSTDTQIILSKAGKKK